MHRTLIAALAALAVSAPAAASINARGLNHDRLIDAGARSGKLTRAEARILRDEQTRIEFKKDGFTADGDYSPREKRIIRDHQDAAARQIDRLKRNDRRRPR